MSEPKLISPLLDNFAMGDPISDHNGIRCCPAMDKATDDKYIVKIISVPASQTQLEAMLLSGAFSSKEDALSYYQSITDGIEDEINILKKLSQLEGVIAFDNYQIVPMEDESGYEIYLLSRFRNTLQHQLRRCSMTQLAAVNLGLDLCAALSVCRRSGYLYVNLKPENIYLSDEQGYRIGDIGLVKLDSLKYASLPERYRSAYTAPEIEDAFSNLNTTLDVYAAGLILYQVFNDGILPFRSESAPDEVFAPPAYADYEMAEIILKACAPNPRDRWQDPVEMGQALVSYMQRNGANDIPITPMVQTAEPESDEEKEGIFENNAADGEIDSLPTDNTAEEIHPEEITEDAIYSEDSEGNLTFLDDVDIDETAPSQIDENINYDEVSEEVSEILNQADDLLAHPTPDPVVQPDPIDVPIPPPLPIEPEETEETDVDTLECEPSEDIAEADDPSDMATILREDTEVEPAKKKSHWVRNVFLAFLIVGLIAGGFFFYTRYYLQPIDEINLLDNENGNLTVSVKSNLPENKLTVICSDTYGNQLKQPVVNGQAKFNNLAPNAAYTIKVEANGFHKLTGNTSTAFTTPNQTNIVQFSAVTGSEDCSAIVSITVEGRPVNQWNLQYVAENEEEKTVTFSGHITTITDLALGKEYKFTLSPAEDIEVIGITEIVHTASNIVKPVDLVITGLTDNILSASWEAPEGTNIESWTVRCYNDDNFNETKVVSQCSASFENVDITKNYTIEVTAAGMSVGERIYAAANAKTVTDLKVDTSKKDVIKISWNSNNYTPQGGWRVLYSVDNSPVQEITCETGSSVELPQQIPGVCYHISLEAADGTAIFGGKIKYSIPVAQKFTGYNVTSDNMEFRMCEKPSKKNWDRHDLSSSDYTTTFAPDQRAGFLIRLSKKPKTSSDKVTILFVIRDKNNNVVSFSSSVKTWKKMWDNKYCAMDIPSLPQAEGKYSISVYFNSALAHTQNFTIKK